jgi:serine/threonine protein kinase
LQDLAFYGLIFVEAFNGDLQQYLDKSDNKLDEILKIKWCLQAAQAVKYCHQKGVIHCDLRPANCLLDNQLDLSLGDFGCSQFRLLKASGLPNYGFFDPRDDLLTPTIAMDLFGLGSIIYTIINGYFPHGSQGLTTSSWNEMSAYFDKVD